MVNQWLIVIPLLVGGFIFVSHFQESNFGNDVRIFLGATKHQKTLAFCWDRLGDAVLRRKDCHLANTFSSI